MARRGDRPPLGISWIVTWPLSAAFAALVFLAAEEMRQPTREVAPEAAALAPDWSAHFPERLAAVDAALRKSALRLPAPVEDERGSGPLRWKHRLYEVELKREEQAQAEAAIEAVRGIDPGLSLSADNQAEGTEVRIGLDGLLVSTVRFSWRDKPKVRPRVALVIGPLGDDLRVARQVIEIEGPVVLGVRPFRPFSRQVAELGRMFDREVIVQLDGSEPTGAGTPTDASARLDAALASVPAAVGVAWHATEAGPAAPDKGMLAELQRRRLLYVGQHGGQGAEAAALPAPTSLPGAAAESAAVSTELGALAARAQSDGTAIGVGEPSDATLSSLREVLPQWQAAQIDFVPVSQLAAPVNLSAR